MTSRLLHPDHSLLLVVDIQEKFVNVLAGYDRVIARTAILIQAFAKLGLPIVVSEQYPKGLGHTVEKLTGILPPGTPVLEKTAFGCGADPAIAAQLQSLGRQQIVVCGNEAHVCVNQTVHQLLETDYQVHLAQDAITSRHLADRDTGLAKMIQSGAVPACTEMVLFELMNTARHPGFKELQALIK